MYSYRGVLLVALLLRIVAVLFSKGYGMHDDHFLIIEASASWVDGYDYNNWLPWSTGNTGLPHGHSFTYVGLNYLFFQFFKTLGFSDPQVLMFFNRLLHALGAMVVVYFGMRIVERLTTKSLAIYAGWFLALLWIMPFVSVRNLVEIAATPFLIYGLWLLVKNESWKATLLAGLVIGFAVSFRFQIGVFAIGLAAVFFFRKEWMRFLTFCSGVLLVFGLTQGLVDYYIWGYPFAEMLAYVTYNMKEGTEYLPNTNYFMYFLVLIGVFFLPLGVLMLIGFFKSWKNWPLLFWPTLLFIVFHTLYPNRQERFILSILPIYMLLGIMGYNLLRSKNTWEQWWKVSLWIFIPFNLLFLTFGTLMYSKKSRVEAMYSIYNNGIYDDKILLEGSSSGRVSMMPKYYGGSWHCTFAERLSPEQNPKVDSTHHYDYIFFFDEKDMKQRRDLYSGLYPQMTLVKVCQPSFVDWLLRELNPKNANEYIEVWKTNSDFRQKP